MHRFSPTRTSVVVAVLLLAASCIGKSAAAQQAKNVVVSNGEPLSEAVFFCFDKAAFPTQENVRLELIQGQNPKRVLPSGPKGSHDELWGYHTVLKIGDRFHLWVMTQTTQWTQYICYATSKDGIEWQKPELGLVEFNGSKKNNIIEAPFKMRSPTCEDMLSGFLVHYDAADPKPERRYKIAADLVHKGSAHHLAIAFSPDGLRWKLAAAAPKPQFMEMSGSTKLRGKCYMTGQSSMPRRLDVFESTDFEKWTNLGSGFSRDHLPVEKEEPSPLPDADKWPPGGIGKGEQVHCGAGLWNRGNVILGVYDAWHGRQTDRRLITIDLGLVISHDAVKYTEPVPNFWLVEARKQPAVPKYGPALTCGKLGNSGDKTLCWYTRPLADGHRVEQGPLPRHVEQARQLVFGHRPADAAAVGLHVGDGDALERVRGEPVVFDGPVAERDQRPAIDVARLRGHALGGTGC